VNVFSETFTTKMPRYAALSPDGRRVVFEAWPALRQGRVRQRRPRLLTPQDADFQLFPSWSRDGGQIVFRQLERPAARRNPHVAAGGGSARTVTDMPGHYRRPRFSPDGQTIVFERGGGGVPHLRRWSEDPGVFRDRRGRREPRAARPASGGNPHFGALPTASTWRSTRIRS
jgi:Tol biopolymer transport system component